MKNIDKVLTTLNLAASDTREDTIKSIIRTTLLESVEPINIKSLKENIDIIYDIELYDTELKDILKDLVESKELIFENDAYSLSDSEKTKLNSLEELLRKNEDLRFNNFSRFIRETFDGNLEEDEIKLIWCTLKDYFYVSFYHYGIRAIEFFHPHYSKGDDSLHQNPHDFNEAIRKLEGKELQEAFKLAVNSFPDFASKEDLDFIDEIGQKTLAFASLGLSPEQASEDLDIELIDWIVYLDTNFLYSILELHSNTEDEACMELLKLIVLNKSIINIKLRYSELTLKELRHKKNDFSSIDETLTDSAIVAILKSDDLDEFARKYYTQLKFRRHETIHPSKVIDLAEVILPKQGIEISRNKAHIESLDEGYLDARIQEYHNFIQESNAIREEFCRKNSLLFRPHYRSESQMYHDIVLRELILKSRGLIKGDEIRTFNPGKYYGLTLDDLLIRFDAYKNKKSAITIYPTFFRPSFILSKLIKLLPVKTSDYKKAFLKAVTSRGFHRELTKSNEIIKVASYLKRFGIDNTEVVLNLISEKLFMERFHAESKSEDFNSELFFENELNRIITLKEQELAETTAALKRESLQSRIEKEKMFEAISEKEQREQDIKMLTSSVKKLKGRIKDLEGRPPMNIYAPEIDFQGAANEKEISRLKEEIKSNASKMITIANESRNTKRTIYINNKVFKWRICGFVYMSLGLIIFLICVIYFLYLGDWKIDNTLAVYEVYKSNIIFTGILWIASAIYSGLFIKRFSDQFSASNRNAFIAQIEKDLPSDLKDLAE